MNSYYVFGTEYFCRLLRKERYYEKIHYTNYDFKFLYQS